jgi:hypothetical protein
MREKKHGKTSHSGIDWQYHERLHICAWPWIAPLDQELRVENRSATSENAENDVINQNIPRNSPILHHPADVICRQDAPLA